MFNVLTPAHIKSSFHHGDIYHPRLGSRYFKIMKVHSRSNDSCRGAAISYFKRCHKGPVEIDARSKSKVLQGANDRAPADDTYLQIEPSPVSGILTNDS